ncbi:hypothetical protein Tco_0575148 [Tanacetum coccineum]
MLWVLEAWFTPRYYVVSGGGLIEVTTQPYHHGYAIILTRILNLSSNCILRRKGGGENTGISKKQDVNGNSLIKPILKRSSDADNVKSAGVESEFEVSLANLGSGDGINRMDKPSNFRVLYWLSWCVEDVLPLVFATRALGIDPGVYRLVIGHDLKP